MLIAQNIDIVGESCLSPAIIELLQSRKPDLLFIDLRRANNNPLQVLERMPTHLSLPPIIYTANDEDLAARLIEIPGAHRLSDPITPERLGIAIERAAKQIDPESTPAQKTHNNGTGYSKRLVIRSRGRIIFIPVSTIRWIAAEENYVRISTETETHLLREPISRLEEKLDPQMFRRVHRSSIVNLEFVKEVRTQSNGESVVILFNGQKLAMSRSYRSRMNQWLLNS